MIKEVTNNEVIKKPKEIQRPTKQEACPCNKPKKKTTHQQKTSRGLLNEQHPANKVAEKLIANTENTEKKEKEPAKN